MSTLKVNTLEEATSGGATYFTAKAWGNFENVGGPTLRRSGNVSSLTDITTNTTEVNLSTAMPNTTYAIVAAEQNASQTAHTNYYSCHWRNVSTSKIKQQWYSTDSNQLGFAIFS